MLNKLFVYGTLGPGRPNEHLLTDIGGTWTDATVRGSLQQKGWGAEMGYPGIVIDNDGENIDAYVYALKNESSL